MANVAKRFGGKVKAAGGVRSYNDAVAMIKAGAYPFPSLLLVLLFQRSFRNKQWCCYNARIRSIGCLM